MADKKQFKDWGVVKFLKENAPNLAVEALSLAGDLLPGGSILSKIGNKITSSNELTKQNKQEALLMLHEEAKMYLEDVQNARNNETERDVSKYSSWLTKNIHEIIAIQFVVGWFLMIIFVFHLFLNQRINLNELVILLAATGIKDMVLLILGYLYGRSKPQS